MNDYHSDPAWQDAQRRYIQPDKSAYPTPNDQLAARVLAAIEMAEIESRYQPPGGA